MGGAGKGTSLRGGSLRVEKLSRADLPSRSMKTSISEWPPSTSQFFWGHALHPHLHLDFACQGKGKDQRSLQSSRSTTFCKPFRKLWRGRWSTSMMRKRRWASFITSLCALWVPHSVLAGSADLLQSQNLVYALALLTAPPQTSTDVISSYLARVTDSIASLSASSLPSLDPSHELLAIFALGTTAPLPSPQPPREISPFPLEQAWKCLEKLVDDADSAVKLWELWSNGTGWAEVRVSFLSPVSIPLD